MASTPQAVPFSVGLCQPAQELKTSSSSFIHTSEVDDAGGAEWQLACCQAELQHRVPSSL